MRGWLRAYLGVRPFQREDYRAVTKVAVEQATDTDRGHTIVSAMVTDLRQRGVILPAALELERIALGARARAREQAYRGGRPFRAKTYVSVLHAMLWVGLAAVRGLLTEEVSEAEFDVAHPQYTLD